MQAGFLGFNFGYFAAHMALFAAMAFLHDRLPAWLPGLRGPLWTLTAGILFGAAGAGSIVLSFTLAPGIFLDGRAVMLALAGAIDGPIAAAVCAVVVIGTRLAFGGSGTSAAVLSALVTAVLGLLIGLHARRGGRLGWGHLLLLSALASASAVSALLLLVDQPGFREIWQFAALRLTAVISVGIVVIGSLLLAQRRRRDLEQQLAAIAGDLPGLLFERVMRPNGETHLRFVSPSVQQVFGLDPAVVAENPDRLLDRLHPEDHPRIMATYRQATAENRPFEIEVRGFRTDGEPRWLRARATPTQRPNGDIVWHGFMFDCTDQHRADEALKVARQQADQANRAKSEFLASMSHELRTPLNAILGFAQLLLYSKDTTLSEKQRGYVDYILRGGNQLLELIKDVLDLAKIESGRLGVSLEPVAVTPLLDEFAETMRSQAKDRGIAFTLTAQSRADEFVQADRSRLLQVLFNLGTNAIKYNRPGGSVTVSTEVRGDGLLRFVVADTGMGIPRHRHPEVFQPFNRLGAEQGAVEGTGIGLSICQRLAELMGGRIGFASEAAVGSRFWVDLPLAVGPAPDVTKTETHPLPSELRAQTVLYIEDNPASLALMNQLIGTLRDVRILAAPTGEIGVALAIAHHPDVIILDIHLPDISGYEVLARLKAMRETADIPVLALSADAMPRDLERGRAAGFTDYLTKPLQVPDIVAAIERSIIRPPLH